MEIKTMNPVQINGKNYTRLAKSSNIRISEAVMIGLKTRGYDAVMYVDKVKGETVYRVVVKEGE